MTATSDEIWADDLLNRRADAEFLYDFLIGEVAKRQKTGTRGSYVLNIDAEWGGGKSFFLDRLRKDIETKGHVVARINAWRDDHAEDPYIAIMSAIDTALAPFTKKTSKIRKAWDATKSNGGRIALKVGANAIKVLAKKHLGVEANDFLPDSDGSFAGESIEVTAEQAIDTGSKEIEQIFDSSVEKLIGQFQKTERAMAGFQERLAEAIMTLGEADLSMPMFILIDELDRCRPNYAIHLLERVKHLFEVEGVVFVFATNSSQLKYSIAGAYGPDFDGFMYLKRFFDRTYVFAELSDELFVADVCREVDLTKIRAPFDDLNSFISSGRAAYGLDLRGLKHVMETLSAVVSAWRHRHKVEVVLLFPLCVHFYRTGKFDWNDVRLFTPADWTIKKVTHRRYGEPAITQFNVAGMIGLAVGRFNRLDALMELNGQAFEPLTGEYYVREMFSAELNGTYFPDKPSVQVELAAMVANAGRLSTER